MGGVGAGGGDEEGFVAEVAGEGHRREQRLEGGGDGGLLVGIEGAGGGGGAAAVGGEAAAHGHVDAHLEHRKQEHGRSVHVRDDVVAVGAPGVVEGGLQRGQLGRGQRPAHAAKETDLSPVVGGLDELLEVMQVVQRERQAVGVQRVAARPRDRIVQQRHTPAPGRLPIEHGRRGGCMPQQVHRPFPARPGQQPARDRRRDPAHPPRGEDPQRRAPRPCSSSPRGWGHALHPRGGPGIRARAAAENRRPPRLRSPRQL